MTDAEHAEYIRQTSYLVQPTAVISDHRERAF